MPGGAGLSSLIGATETGFAAAVATFSGEGSVANEPIPFPSKIEMVLEPVSAETRSRLPSLLKSPVAIERGSIPVATVPVPLKPPFPSPSRIAMLSSPTLATARSVKASLLKLPVTTELGASPTETECRR